MKIRNISIREYMTTDVVSFHSTDFIEVVVETLLDKKISGAPVLDDDGRLVGMISEKDCQQLYVDGIYNNMPSGTVDRFMSTKVKTLKNSDTVLDAARAFMETPFRRFPIVDSSDSLVGQISRRDVLRALQSYMHDNARV